MPADKGYRRRVLTIYVVIVLLGLVLIGWVLPLTKEYIAQLEPETASRAMKTTLVMVFLTIIPIALYILAFGRKVMQHERFPPPGVKVIKDTKIIEGKKARARGRVLVVLSLVLIFLGVIGALYTPFMLNKVKNPKAKLTKAHTLQQIQVTAFLCDRKG
jgi:peptidoglycan biosynthesis protein MviN/MurJ (putative lipid II flippase)